MGTVLVISLAGLQLAHWGWLYLDRVWIDSIPYRMLLFTVAPAFWGFSQPLLRMDRPRGFQPILITHVLPIAIAPWLGGEVALPLAFVVGAGYLLSLAHDVYKLRGQRDQFAREILILGSIFVIALGVAGLGTFQAHLPGKLFFVFYSIAIGLAFLLVQITLGLRPHLPEEVTETAKTFEQGNRWLLLFVSAFVFFTDTHVRWYRVLGGITHAVAHLGAAFALHAPK